MTSEYRRSWLVSFLLVAFICDFVSSAPCPVVDNCLDEFAADMVGTGHDTGEYCNVLAKVIACLKKGECSTETQNHKDAELKHFQTDATCSAGEKLCPGVSMLFIVYTVWRFWCQH